MNINLANIKKHNLRVVAITGGANVPSRRFRIDALKPYLAAKKVGLTELCPTFSRYPPPFRLFRFPWFVAALLERFTFLFRVRGYDAVILQREMISTLPTLERLLPKPWILDVDDAIHLHRGGLPAEFMAKSCSAIVCGNQYLAGKFTRWNSNVVVIPTGVDTEQLRPMTDKKNSGVPKIIGWIGTAGNYQYLKLIEPALKRVLNDFPTVRLQIISNQFPMFLNHLGKQLDYKSWYPGIENDLLPRFTIGIMPLADTEWARGKCAFKMLQYMAAGIPVVVSPVGMNREILADCSVGFAAQDNEQWIKALTTLLRSATTASQFGKNGRQIVENKYSLTVVSLMWQQLLSNLILKN